MSAHSIRIMLLTAAVGLSGCGAGVEEVQAWMDQQRREVKPGVTQLSAPKKFEPEPYASLQAVDPFNPQKLTSALRQQTRQSSSLLAAEEKRRKEPLEAFPLDTMAMVGSVNRQGRPFALVRVDKLLYQVRVGDYLGQNYGRIMKIDETQLELREIVQDASGEWVERTTNLQLQERAR